MMSSMAVAIVNYNTRSHLRRCLDSVRIDLPSEVVVVDNASSDGSAEMVRSEYPWVLLHSNKINVGFGAAANQAINECTSKYVLLLNSDVLLQPGAIEALSSYLDRHPRAAVAGPRLTDSNGTLQASCYPFPTVLNALFINTNLGRLIGCVPILRNHYLPAWRHTHTRVIPWVKGAAMAIRREAIDTVGAFDESFFMYFEEVDLCYRLYAAGWEIHFAPVTTVVHVGAASTMRYHTEMAVQFLASTLQFYRRHYSGIRLAALRMQLRGIVIVRWIIDRVRLCVASDKDKRAGIAAGVAAWQQALHGQW